MTNEEIIKKLNQIADDFENERLDTTEWCGYEYDPDEAAEAVRAGAEAEEYRTPAKVKVIHNTDPDAIESFEWVCPRCNTPHDEVAEIPYCFKCGQALDWTDEGFDKYMEEHGYVKHDYAKQ